MSSIVKDKDRNIFEGNHSFESVFQHYYAGLSIYAARIVRDRDLASDILQDIFVNFWEKRHRLANTTLKTYLFNSVRNECINHLRRLDTRSRYQEDILTNAEMTGPETWDYFIESELRLLIEKAIDKLPPQRKFVIRRNRMEGKTTAEIAEELHLTKRTVDKHLEIALRQLRSELSEYLPLLIVMGGLWRKIIM